MRIVIAGASGLIGTALTAALISRGDEVVRLVRRPASGPAEVEWHPDRGELDPGALDGAHAVINLSGASVGKLPWTRKYKRELWSSRINATRTLAAALAAPRTGGRRGSDATAGAGSGTNEASKPMFVSASASGFYGSQPGVTIDEGGAVGDTFLARLCAEWEREALAATDSATVALLRTSPVLHPEGVLKPMITLTKLGFGGPLGNGRQLWPWISLDDEVRAILHVIDNRIAGPVNLAAPGAATASEIGRALARKLRRPFFVPAPAFALRLGLGRDTADSLLLADADVAPRVLLESGFEFANPTVQSAIDASL